MTLAPAKSPPPSKARAIVQRTRGRTHGPVTRLMSPSDLGEILKPFVFRDFVDYEGAPFSAGLHPVAPSPINYLAVRLKSGERWRYEPPAGHTVLWTAVASGTVSVPDELRHGDLAAFEPSSETVEVEARTDAEFVLGSAVPHQYDLILGAHSVHTTPAALRDAQAHLAVIRTRLVQEGRP